MATLTGTEHYFIDHHTRYDVDEPYVTWRYNTNSDYLTLSWRYPVGHCAYLDKEIQNSRPELVLDASEASALLRAMKEWERV